MIDDKEYEARITRIRWLSEMTTELAQIANQLERAGGKEKSAVLRDAEEIIEEEKNKMQKQLAELL